MLPVWLSWLVATASLATTVLAGRRFVAAWYICVINQFGWAWIAVGTKQWGLLVSCVAFTIVGMWNLISWTKDPPRRKKVQEPQMIEGNEMVRNESIGEMEIQKRFNYFFKPNETGEEQVVKSKQHLTLQLLFIDMARALDTLLPPGRTKALAMTELESASMWGHKAIQEQDPDPYESLYKSNG